MPGPSGAPSSLVHYRPTSPPRPRCRPRHRPWCIAPLPVSGQDIDVESVARIPGTTQALADGFTHAPDNPAGNVVAVIPQYS